MKQADWGRLWHVQEEMSNQGVWGPSAWGRGGPVRSLSGEAILEPEYGREEGPGEPQGPST